MIRRVISEAAEQAQSDIRLLQAERLRAARLQTPAPVGRIAGFGPTAGERAMQLALATLVAVTEHFSTSRLRALPNVTEDDLRSWPKQERAWARFARVRLQALQAYQAFRGCNEARNAVMHGRGILTPLQLSANSVRIVRARLSAAGISCVRDRVIIGHDDVHRCAEICWMFVGQLDSSIP